MVLSLYVTVATELLCVTCILSAVLGAGVALKLTLFTLGLGVTLLVLSSPFEQALSATITAAVIKDVLNTCMSYLQLDNARTVALSYGISVT